MSVHRLLREREDARNPIRVGMIGAGRYGAMYLAQTRFTPGVEIVALADLDPARARANLLKAGWNDDALVAAATSSDINDAWSRGRVSITEDAAALAAAELDVVVESTGTVDAAARHAWTAMEHGKHVVMVSTEADCHVGLALQRKAEQEGVIYSFGYGDEPAELAEIIDWARCSGFEVACIGKYIEYFPGKRYVNPDTVWDVKTNYTAEQIASGELNAKLFSSFVDGTKTLLETCCAANASGLIPQSGGIVFPTLEYDDMANALRPRDEGGILERMGTIEVPSNYHPDGMPVKKHLRWGVFISAKACSEQAASFLTDFRNEDRVMVDDSGFYCVMYRPTHILGLELNKSVASVALLGLPTGAPEEFVADMVNVAKKDLQPGDTLDGPGAYTTYGQLLPATESLANRYLPIGFSEGVKVVRPVKRDQILTYDDVEIDESLFTFGLRKKIEAGAYSKHPATYTP